jgi:hypothetical protein
MNNNDPYASHLPVLNFVFDSIPINFALEIGMGKFSTPLLVERTTDLVTSIENQDKDWYDKMSKNRDERFGTHWYPRYDPTASSAFYKNEYFDLVFVDGSAITRVVAVAHSMDVKTAVIIAHDIESGWYGYHLLDDHPTSKQYAKFDYKPEGLPWTRLYTINDKLISDCKNSQLFS